MKKILCVFLCFILVVGAFCVYACIQHKRDYEAVDVQYTYLRVGTKTYEPAELVEIADVIFEGIVLDVSFFSQPSGSGSYMVSTVYAIAVTRTYKGETETVERFVGGHGREGYKLREQLQAMQDAGAPEGYNRICIWKDEQKLQRGDTYLFFAQEYTGSEHNVDLIGINGLQDALKRGDTESSKAYYDEVKEHLPYVPHPLLVWGAIAIAIGGAGVASWIIQKKKKNAIETPEVTEET